MELKYTNVDRERDRHGVALVHATIKVTGMPWYPAFAAFPSPVAPPTPNIPCPVIALTQVTASIMPATMKMQMVGQLGDPMAPFHGELFEAICDGVRQVLQDLADLDDGHQRARHRPDPDASHLRTCRSAPSSGGVGTMTPGGFV